MLLVVIKTTQLVTGAPTTAGEAFKAIGLAFFFVILANFTMISFMIGTSGKGLIGAPVLMIEAFFLAAYVLGFKVGLGTDLGASVVISLISSIVSTALFWGVTRLL